jgi:hypothetical protein
MKNLALATLAVISLVAAAPLPGAGGRTALVAHQGKIFPLNGTQKCQVFTKVASDPPGFVCAPLNNKDGPVIAKRQCYIDPSRNVQCCSDSSTTIVTGDGIEAKLKAR